MMTSFGNIFNVTNPEIDNSEVEYTGESSNSILLYWGYWAWNESEGVSVPNFIRCILAFMVYKYRLVLWLLGQCS